MKSWVALGSDQVLTLLLNSLAVQRVRNKPGDDFEAS